MKKIITAIALALIVSVAVTAQPYWEKLHQSDEGLIFETLTISPRFNFSHNGSYTFVMASGYHFQTGDVQIFLRSNDNGTSWTEVSANNLDLSYARGIYGNDGGTLLVVRFEGIYRSTDNGENFTQSTVDVNFNTDRSTAVYANGIWYIIVKTSSGSGSWVLLKSTDDGATFTNVGEGVPLTTIYDSNEPIAVVGNTIVVRNKYTTDEGGTWHDVQGDPNSHSLGMFVGYYNGEYYYVGKATSNSTEFIKTPDVENPVWTRVGTDTHSATINRHFMTSNGAIFIQSSSHLRVYINGVWNNNINEGYVQQQFQYPYPTFAETPNGSVIARALETGAMSGLFRYLGETTNINNFSGNFNVNIYPNPAQETITINNLPIGATLNITDITGKTVYGSTINNEQITIDTVEFTNGVYILQVVKNGVVSNKKLIINK